MRAADRQRAEGVAPAAARNAQHIARPVLWLATPSALLLSVVLNSAGRCGVSSFWPGAQATTATATREAALRMPAMMRGAHQKRC